MEDPEEVKRLIRRNAWATFVSPASTGLVASHYPVILDEDARRRASPSSATSAARTRWPTSSASTRSSSSSRVPTTTSRPPGTAPGDIIPTWNHVTAHLYGTPQILSDDENYEMLGKLTDHFESHYPGGHSLAEDEEGTRRVAKGTVGLRMRR